MRSKQRLFSIAVAVLAAGALVWFASTSRAAYETPEYKVIRTDGKLEVRDYPPMTLVGTPMSDDSKDGSFMRLFRFIDGGNERSEKIAMTTPVLIDSAPGKKTMSFVGPRKFAESGVPKPSGAKISVAMSEGARYAVFGFSGGRTSKNEVAAVEKLKAWLEAQKIAAMGSPVFAYYDPPWTPIFMRRNEVMIRISSP
jgi:hypothetical protein